MFRRRSNLPKILTPFADDVTGDDLDAKDLINKYCYATAAVRFESIFCGAKVSPQVKLHEAMTRLANSRSKRLLRPVADAQVRTIAKDQISSALGTEDLSDDGSIASSDEEEEVPAPVVQVKKKVIRKGHSEEEENK